MECPHLCDSVKVNRDFIKNKKCELTTSTTEATTVVHASAASTALISSSSATSSSSTRRSSPSATSNGNKLWKCLGTSFYGAKCIQTVSWLFFVGVRWNHEAIGLPHSWTTLMCIAAAEVAIGLGSVFITCNWFSILFLLCSLHIHCSLWFLLSSNRLFRAVDVDSEYVDIDFDEIHFFCFVLFGCTTWREYELSLYPRSARKQNKFLC